MRRQEQLPSWGDPVRPRFDWKLTAFIVGYGAGWAVLVHFAQGIVR